MATIQHSFYVTKATDLIRGKIYTPPPLWGGRTLKLDRQHHPKTAGIWPRRNALSLNAGSDCGAGLLPEQAMTCFRKTNASCNCAYYSYCLLAACLAIQHAPHEFVRCHLVVHATLAVRHHPPSAGACAPRTEPTLTSCADHQPFQRRHGIDCQLSGRGHEESVPAAVANTATASAPARSPLLRVVNCVCGSSNGFNPDHAPTTNLLHRRHCIDCPSQRPVVLEYAAGINGGLLLL